MRILGISGNPHRLAEMNEALTAQEGITLFKGAEGALAAQPSLPVQGEFDVLVLDCTRDAGAELEALSRLQPMYPGMQTILVAEHASAELLLRALRLGVREVIEPPVKRAELLAALRRVEQSRQAAPHVHGKILAFVSCKGGSGSTFLATNLGYALAAVEKKRVLLIDLNLQFGDASLFVSDRRPAMTIADLSREMNRVDPGFLRSSLIDVLPNYGVLAAPNDPAQSAEVRPAHVDSILRIARTEWDYVIIDAGRSLDAVSVRALDLADFILPVLQLTLPFIRDGKRLLDLMRSLDYPPSKIRPIVNRLEKSSELTIADLERTLGTKVYATVPNHYASVAASVNQGVPILKLAPKSPVSKALTQLASEIDAPAARSGEGGWLTRLLARS